jgi:MFS family permease
MIFQGLWQHADFRRLWAGQTVSRFGAEITTIALPLTGVLVLDASALEMGLLGAAAMLPYLLIGLFAGVWVDRLPRKPIMIIADLGRAGLLVTIPIAAIIDVLIMEWLYVVAFLTGTMSLFFDVAYQSFLPALVRRDQLVEGNSKLEMSSSSAQVIGPSIAGGIVQAITAPIAIALNGISYLFSAIFLQRIHVEEPPRGRAGKKPRMWPEIREGLSFVVRHQLLRPITGCGTTHNFSSHAIRAILVLFLSSELGLSPAAIGFIFAAGGVGSMAGAITGARVSDRLGIGPAIGGMQFLTACCLLVIPLATGPATVIVGTLMVAQFFHGFSRPVYNIAQVSLRQTITPDALLGRMNASIRFISWGVMPLGALLGGVLGEAVGLRTAILLLVSLEFAAVLWIALSPVRDVQKTPDVAEASVA